MDKIHASIKKEIGRRFKRFREAIGKTQTQLAKELNVYQSTITNIEVGKTFPGIKYLHYFHHTYGLNTNWLLSNKGEIFVSEEARTSSAASLLECHVPKNNPLYEKYAELIALMKVPMVEQIILAKLVELKVVGKEEIKEFWEKENLQNA
ncbi:MAG: helix-turn-helix transcriptional regulator [Candidatus Aminicenantes bacterium]|nr:MAG: helix-turn-helix transcriptional regulator [Candidatus Aminicenantes bacterium]